MYVMLSKFNW